MSKHKTPTLQKDQRNQRNMNTGKVYLVYSEIQPDPPPHLDIFMASCPC